MKSPSHLFSNILWLVLLSVSMTACASGQRQPAHTSLTLESITFDGLERTYYLHLPPDYASLSSLPVVLVLHGGGRADGDEIARRTGYNKFADQDGFIAVYPNGVDAKWNDGRGETYRKTRGNTDIDDVGFIAALIDRIVRDYKGDAAEIYVTGLSNGGMMTLRLGCEISGKLAAIAPVIANIPKKIIGTCKPETPLPVLVMNGTDDPLVPWDGGSVRFLRRTMGEVVSTQETIRFWARHNQCNAEPDIETLEDSNRKDGSSVEVTSYTHCRDRAEVILYTILGGGHTFPGSNIPDRPRLLGKKNNDIDGPQVIWDFFKRF